MHGTKKNVPLNRSLSRYASLFFSSTPVFEILDNDIETCFPALFFSHKYYAPQLLARSRLLTRVVSCRWYDVDKLKG